MNLSDNQTATSTETPATADQTDTPEATGAATYSPEDNKLRLYVGRVPRDEYLKLRAEGWKALHKQREAGGGDFVATWTPERRDTALAYSGGFIADEDMGPAERAADRAERFADYRDKRTDDATGHADRYDAGPRAHGYQNQARAERAAARHDRIGGRAVDAWDKAEYWQRRTAGVIAHALHRSAPGVRMGRIKELEALLRAKEAVYEKAGRFYDLAAQVRDITDPEEQTRRALILFGGSTGYHEYPHPDDPAASSTIYGHMTNERRRKITGAEACALYFTDRARPDVANNDWANHYKLRLAYERQMLEAQGGRLGDSEMVCGGFLYGKQIYKINKSTVSGRVTSVCVKVPRVQSWTYRVENVPGADYALAQFDTERLPPDAYRAPTAEELEAYEATRKAEKAAAKATKPAPIPLINPTPEDAERLQAVWNERKRQHGEERKQRDKYAYIPELEGEPSQVLKITQAVYSANSGGAYSKTETVEVYANGFAPRGYERRTQAGRPVCKIRITSGENYKAARVIILTDKPQKPLPVEVWRQPEPASIMNLTGDWQGKLAAAIVRAKQYELEGIAS